MQGILLDAYTTTLRIAPFAVVDDVASALAATQLRGFLVHYYLQLTECNAGGLGPIGRAVS